MFTILNITQQFVSRSLDDVKNEEWLIEVGLAMGEKERVLERYMNYPEEKVRRCHILNLTSLDGKFYA